MSARRWRAMVAWAVAIAAPAAAQTIVPTPGSNPLFPDKFTADSAPFVDAKGDNPDATMKPVQPSEADVAAPLPDDTK